jgi:putative phage-type endonuclease
MIPYAHTIVPQYSEAWFAARCGKATASRMADLTARTKSGWGASRANYMAQLIAERLTGVPADSFSNAAMQWGVEKEPEAVAAYNFFANTGPDVEPCGFVAHPRIEMSGASPDGVIGLYGLIEVKCPNTATHIDTLLSGAVPEKYVKQMQWQMACCPRAQWCDYCSYDPRMPEAMRLFVKRIPRDDKMIGSLEGGVAEFLSELDDKLDALRSRYLIGVSPVKAKLAASVEIIDHEVMMAQATRPR